MDDELPLPAETLIAIREKAQTDVGMLLNSLAQEVQRALVNTPPGQRVQTVADIDNELINEITDALAFKRAMLLIHRESARLARKPDGA